MGAVYNIIVHEGWVTDNFHITEMSCSANDEVLLNPRTLAHANRIQQLRNFYGDVMHVTSWYRTLEYNRTLPDSSDSSQHILGLATDIWIPEAERNEEMYQKLKAEWYRICGENGLGGGVGFYDSFIHFDSRAPRAFWDNRTKKAVHYKVGYTDVIEVNPMALKIAIVDTQPAKVALSNFVNGGYIWWQADGKSYSLGILVSEGKVLSNRQPHNLPAGTFIIYKDGSVAVKELLDITTETNVWFAVSGCTILPTINMAGGGFIGAFADISYARLRPMIGYRKKDNKVIIAVRPATTIERGQQSLINLGCDFGITLDAGTSTTLKVDGVLLYDTIRRLHNLITW